MTPTSETLSAQAAQLAPEERIQLVERILNSLDQPPPRQNTCRLHRTMNLGARRERIGSIRTSIQRSRGSTHAAAGERIAAGGGA